MTIEDLAQPQLVRLSGENSHPPEGWVSPIPPLDDVSPEDYAELKQAAFAKLDAGIKLAVEVSNMDLTSPSFYISSNLPDGAVIDVYVIGVPDSLLNQLSYSGPHASDDPEKTRQDRAREIRRRQAAPARRLHGVCHRDRATARGHPRALLVQHAPAAAQLPAELPVGLRLIASEIPVPRRHQGCDLYEPGLKEFHDKLRAKAAWRELAEIKLQLDSIARGPARRHFHQVRAAA